MKKSNANHQKFIRDPVQRVSTTRTKRPPNVDLFSSDTYKTVNVVFHNFRLVKLPVNSCGFHIDMVNVGVSVTYALFCDNKPFSFYILLFEG